MTDLIRLPMGMVNCYLLRLGDKSVLVDCANPNSQDKLLALLSRHNLTPDDLDMVLLTHNHPDHSGTALWFREHYGLPIAMHPLDTTVAPLKSEGVGGFLLGTASKAAVGSTEKLLPDILLENGQSLKEYGFPATVIHLPGHTAGSVGILLDGKRLLCGDHYMNFVGPHLAYIAEDFDRLRISERKLLLHPIDTVFPGHGKPFRFARVQSDAEIRAAYHPPFAEPKQADCASSSSGGEKP